MSQAYKRGIVAFDKSLCQYFIGLKSDFYAVHCMRQQHNPVSLNRDSMPCQNWNHSIRRLRNISFAIQLS